MTLNADISLEGMAYTADYYAGNTGSIDVWDSDWNDHYMWLVTHHDGRLTLVVSPRRGSKSTRLSWMGLLRPCRRPRQSPRTLDDGHAACRGEAAAGERAMSGVRWSGMVAAPVRGSLSVTVQLDEGPHLVASVPEQHQEGA